MYLPDNNFKLYFFIKYFEKSVDVYSFNILSFYWIFRPYFYLETFQLYVFELTESSGQRF